jgi:hypothetical protein
MMGRLRYEAAWFAATIINHDTVTQATALPNGHVRLERKDLPPITVAPVAADRIDRAIVETVLASAVPTEIVLIPKVAHYDWSARRLAEDNGSTVHTFKELYTFLNEPDPRPFVDKNVRYARDRLGQHSKVDSVEMICEASMLLKRPGALSDVVAAIEYEYEFSEEALVRALTRHPDATVVVNTNPNGKPTTAALAHAESAEIPLFGVAELMGALNYDGEGFREYMPRRRQ